MPLPERVTLIGRKIRSAFTAQNFGKLTDTIVGILSPKRGYERTAWRGANSVVQSYLQWGGGGGGYEAAKQQRPNSTWIAASQSADADIIPGLAVMRARSRDLFMNDGHAASVMATYLDNIVGTGLALQARVDARVLGMTPDQAAELNRNLERYWGVWCRESSSDGRCAFAEQQAMVVSQDVMNGEILVLPLMLDEKAENRTFSLALEMIEADRLDNPQGKTKTEGGAEIRGGVEVGSRGNPVAYWIMDGHPGDASLAITRGVERSFTRYPSINEFGRPNVMHLFAQTRPGQSRGVPLLAPVMPAFRHLKDYCEAEVISAKVAACFAMAVTKPGAQREGLARATRIDGQQREQEVSPGAIYYLEPGESVTGLNPGRPNTAFESFVQTMLVDIGAALGLPYELVARDFRKTTYSSARAALLEARRTFQRRQRYLSARFCLPVYEMFVEECFLRGLVRMPDYYANRDALCRARWISPAWGMINPKEEVGAYSTAVNENFMTKGEVCAAISGGDAEEIAEQRSLEKKRETELDITPPAPAGAAPLGTDDAKNKQRQPATVGAPSDGEDEGDDDE